MRVNTPLAASIAIRELRTWVLPLVSILSLSALWAWLYRDAIVAAVTAWWVSPTYSHCFLIIPICGWLVWLKRHELSRLEPESAPLLLLLAIPIGLVSVAGTLASINELQQLAAIGMLQIVIAACLGWGVYSAILFPALLLFFLVPTGQYLVPPLQRLTTLFVSASLSTLNILHYTEGNVIELANGRFLVAEACAGLRFLIANIVLCLIFAYFAFRRPFKIILFMLAAVLVPIAANCLRALGIVLIAHWTNGRLAAGTDHLVYGWLFSIFILALLFGIAIRARDAIDGRHPLVPLREPAMPSATREGAVIFLAAIALVLPSLLLQAQASAFPAMHPAVRLATPGTWSKVSGTQAWSPYFPNATEQFRQSLQQLSHPPVEFAYGYYAAGSHPPSDVQDQLWDEEKFNAVGQRETTQGRTRLKEVVLAGPAGRWLVWWTYWKDGSFTPSTMEVRLLALTNATRAHSGIAVIVLATKMDGTDDGARNRLGSALWTLNSFSPQNDGGG